MLKQRFIEMIDVICNECEEEFNEDNLDDCKCPFCGSSDWSYFADGDD